MKVIILSGIPGSGKSTALSKLKEQHGSKVFSVSADYYFTKADGSYVFDPKELPEAHGACLREFVSVLNTGEGSFAGRNSFSHLVVDNTNTTVAEVAPYAALALAYGHELEIQIFVCHPDVAAKRNVHGVSAGACGAMAQRLEEQRKLFPPWWRTSYIHTSEEPLLMPKKTPVYAGVFFSEETKAELLKAFKPTHPNIHLDHITLAFGKAMKPEYPIGEKRTVKILGRIRDEKGEALLISHTNLAGLADEKQRLHVTVSCADGVKPAYSNELISRKDVTTEWLDEPYQIEGVVDVFPRTVK